MKRILFLLSTLLILSNPVLSRDRVISSPENSNLILGVVSEGAFVETVRMNKNTIEFKKEIQTKGPKQLDTNSPLDATRFDSTTGLYGHHLNGTGSQDITAWIGGEDLSNTNSLTAQVSPLGDTVYCGFDGTTYLSNATINSNTTFTWMGWVYFDDWDNGVQEMIASQTNQVNGWQIDKTSTNKIGLYIFTGVGHADINYPLYTPGMTGWNHILVSRNHNNFAMMAFNGEIVAYSSIAGIPYSTGGNYELGSRNGGQTKMTGRLWDVALHSGVAYTPNQARMVYAAGSGRFATKDRNGQVRIDGKQKVDITLYPTAYSTNSNVYSDSYYVLYPPESGKYLLDAKLVSNGVSGTNTMHGEVRFANNGSGISGTARQCYLKLGATTTTQIFDNFDIVHSGYFSANDMITVQSRMVTGTNFILTSGSGVNDTYFSIRKD